MQRASQSITGRPLAHLSTPSSSAAFRLRRFFEFAGRRRSSQLFLAFAAATSEARQEKAGGVQSGKESRPLCAMRLRVTCLSCVHHCTCDGHCEWSDLLLLASRDCPRCARDGRFASTTCVARRAAALTLPPLPSLPLWMCHLLLLLLCFPVPPLSSPCPSGTPMRPIFFTALICLAVCLEICFAREGVFRLSAPPVDAIPVQQQSQSKQCLQRTMQTSR